jgi:hypothetical protein
MKDQIPEGFVPNTAKFISNQPHLTVTGFAICNPLLTRLLIEVDQELKKPRNCLNKKPQSVLDVPSQGMFYHSPLNTVLK